MSDTPLDPLDGAFTRRQFVSGMIGAGALIMASGLALSGCSNKDSNEELLTAISAAAPKAKISSLTVSDTQIVSGVAYADAPADDYFALQNTFDLPLGSLVYQASNKSACVLAPGEARNVLIRLASLDLETGVLTTLLDRALNDTLRYCIYDARMSDSAAIWVEADMTAGNWIVYAASLSGTTLATPVKLDEGDVVYDPPMLCAYGSNVYWTRMPDPEGSASMEDSVLKTARLDAQGVHDLQVVYTSHGRMITNPQASDGHITIVPRVDTDGVRYQLTALDARTHDVVAISVLPSGLRVSDCVYMRDDFTFCIEANYDFAGGLRYFGTYEQLKNNSVFYANKVPSSPALVVDDKLIIKSTMNVVGFDVVNQRSFIVEKPNDCAEYGDLLAGCGIQDRLVIYTTIVNKTNSERSLVRVRVYAGA